MEISLQDEVIEDALLALDFLRQQEKINLLQKNTNYSVM